MRRPKPEPAPAPGVAAVQTRIDAAWVLRQLEARGASLVEIASWASDYTGGPLVTCRIRVGDLLRDLEHRGDVYFDRGRWIAAPARPKGGHRAAG